MRQWTVFLFTAALMTACGNENRKETGNKKKSPIDNEAAKDNTGEGKDDDKGKSYHWTKAEQNKFTDDCINGAEGEDVAPEKLKDFCNCMLTQAQKYYRHYHQMDEDSNENYDAEILEKCTEVFLKPE